MTDTPYSKRETDMLLKRIDENIQDGFAGVHERLDKLNGQTAKNTEFRLKSEGAFLLIKVIGVANILAWGAAMYKMLN